MSALQTSQAIGGVGGCTHSWDVSIGEAVVSSAPRGWPGDSPSKGRMVPKLLHLAPWVGPWGITGSLGSALGMSLGSAPICWGPSVE